MKKTPDKIFPPNNDKNIQSTVLNFTCPLTFSTSLWKGWLLVSMQVVEYHDFQSFFPVCHFGHITEGTFWGNISSFLIESSINMPVNFFLAGDNHFWWYGSEKNILPLLMSAWPPRTKITVILYIYVKKTLTHIHTHTQKNKTKCPLDEPLAWDTHGPGKHRAPEGCRVPIFDR